MFKPVIISVLALLFSIPSLQSESLTLVEPQDLKESSKKTLLILSSHGGYGHSAACNTLQKLIGDQYNIKVIYPIDQLRIWGVPSVEDVVYNMMIKKGWIRSLNFLSRHVAPNVFRSHHGKLEKIIRRNIDAYQPDLVISLIPFVNYSASEAARKKEVPYLLITTDNDLKNWVCGFEKLKDPQFKITIGFDLPTTRDLLRKYQIPDDMIETIGLPLRPEFIAQKDETLLREEYHIPSAKPVVLIMMGGAGGKTAYDYARKIASLELNTHLIVVCGRNEKLKKDLSKIKLHEGNTMTLLGFTDKVADLMTIADLVITKPGPGTINEAIAKQLPVLVDNTDISLFWERANSDLVVRYGIGHKIREFKDVKNILKSYLNEDLTRSRVEDSFANVPPNLFHERIIEVIAEMVNKPDSVVAMPSQNVSLSAAEALAL